MRARDSFSDAVAVIWRITQAEARAGDPLTVQEIAAASGLSATPLREAMAWLCGQGLVERRPGRGYFVPSVTARSVADIYGLHRRYLLWALEFDGSHERPSPSQSSGEGPLDLLEAVVAASGDAALIAAHRRALLRLRQLQWAEPAPDSSEIAALAEAERAFLEGAREPVVAFVEAYHAVRIRSSSEIAARLRGSQVNINPI